MLDTIKKLPLAVSGLILSLVALANLLTPFLPIVRPILQSIALFGILLLFVKFLSDRRAVLQEFRNPIVASSFATFLMAIQLLSSSLPLPKVVGHGFWYLAVLTYLSYIVFFTYRFARQRDLSIVYPSWFIVYVGFAMVGVSAPAFQEYGIGLFSLVFASLSFLILAPIVLYRLSKYGIGKDIRPILAIFAAPVSLILTAYLSLHQEVNSLIVISILIVSQLIYSFVILRFYTFIGSRFSPLYSAFTFPAVSTAIGLRLALAKLAVQSPILLTLSYLEIVVATTIVLYVLYSYIILVVKSGLLASKAFQTQTSYQEESSFPK